MMSREWVKDTREAWEKETNEALERAGREERVDHRSLASLRDEAERSGDLERAAELSREPNVHLGPEAYRAGDLEQAGRGEAGQGIGVEISGVLARAERVEKDNEALRQERDGLIDRIKERIAAIYRELQELLEKIRVVRERIKEWEKERDREWVHGGGYERDAARRTAEITRKYSHETGPQISNAPSSSQPTHEHKRDRDRGPSR